MTPGDQDDPFADVAVTVASIKRDTLRIQQIALEMDAIHRLADRSVGVLAAELRFAREGVQSGVAASAATALLMACLGASLLGLSLSAAITIGLLAGIGSGLPGFVLIVRPDLLTGILDTVDGWRR